MADERRRQLRLLINICGFLDLFGVSIIYPLLAGQARSLGASPSIVGLIGSIYGSLQLFSSPLVGHLSDAYERKSVLLVCLIVTALGYLMMGASTTLGWLMIARIPSGLFKHTQGISKVYLTDVTPSDQRASTFGSYNSWAAVGFIVGPVIGGNLAMVDNGFQLVSIVSAGIFLFNAMFVLFAFSKASDISKDLKLKTCSSNDSSAKEMPLLKNKQPVSLIEGIKSVPWNNLADVFAIRFLLSFAMILFRSNFTSILEFRYNTTPRFNGYILSFNGIIAAASGSLVGSIASWFPNLTKMHRFFCCTLVMSLISITFAPTVWIVVAGLIPLSISTSVLRVTNSTSLYKKSSDKEKGFLTGLSDSFTAVARMLGPAIGGFAQDYSVYGPGLAGTGLAAAATGISAFADLEGSISAEKKEKSE